MLTQVVPYTDGDYQLEGFVACPAEEKLPLVILCHAWKGRDNFICEKSQIIASLGYAGFAIDMYGKGISGKSREENAALKRPFLEDRAFLKRRLLKGYEAACSLPFVDTTRIVALGYGFGGVCALDLARSGVALNGAVSVYGHFEPPRHAQPIKAKILLLHGYQDPISPMCELLTFQQELDRNKVDWQSHLFGNAVHAFATPSAQDPDAGILYNPVSARRAWLAIENFLAELFTA